jgi:hypothetical protein
MAWSYSALKNFETCPKRYYHYNVAKDVREPESDQLREGNALHAAFDKRLKGAPLVFPYTHHEPMLAKIVDAPGQTLAEQKLALTSSFQPTTYFAKNVWFRTVIDAGKLREESATIFDWKTGQVREDPTQSTLMAATVFAYNPAIVRITASLVFLAEGKVCTDTFLREDLPEMWGEILPRVEALRVARETNAYEPKPSGLCRRYCAVHTCPHNGKYRG